LYPDAASRFSSFRFSCFARIVENVHFLSDVLGSIALAAL
jgi:hypothetical protein